MYSNMKQEDTTIVTSNKLPTDRVISLCKIRPIGGVNFEAKVIPTNQARLGHSYLSNMIALGETAEEAIAKAIEQYQRQLEE